MVLRSHRANIRYLRLMVVLCVFCLFVLFVFVCVFVSNERRTEKSMMRMHVEMNKMMWGRGGAMWRMFTKKCAPIVSFSSFIAVLIAYCFCQIMISAVCVRLWVLTCRSECLISMQNNICRVVCSNKRVNLS